MPRAQYLYVAAFDGGLLKVGRSAAPYKRIGQHEDRLACAGIRLLARHIAVCAGSVKKAELVVIKRCAATAAERRQSEWFVGLTFDDVCHWVDSACSGGSTDEAPLFPDFERAIESIGLAVIASRLQNVSLQRVQNWRTRGVPVAEAAALEKACEGIFTRKHMFPKTYARIWPELARKREKVAA